jgi:hypothetical protein
LVGATIPVDWNSYELLLLGRLLCRLLGRLLGFLCHGATVTSFLVREFSDPKNSSQRFFVRRAIFSARRLM